MEASGQHHMLAALPLGKVAAVPIEYEPGWAPELVWLLWKREKSLTFSGNQTMICWLFSP
jgi:hypothetical protein